MLDELRRWQTRSGTIQFYKTIHLSARDDRGRGRQNWMDADGLPVRSDLNGIILKAFFIQYNMKKYM